MIPGYEDHPLADGSEFLDQPLFWPCHLGSLLRDLKAQELAFGPDWEAADELSREITAPTSWPVFTVPVGNGCSVHVVYRNLKDDMGVDYLLHDPARSTALRLATDEGCFMGPGLSWRELNAVSPDHSTLLLLLPMLGDADVPADGVDRVAAALTELTWVEEPETVASLMLASQGQWGPATWRSRDGVWICDGGYSYRCPHNRFSFTPEQLAAVSAALN